MKQILCCGPTMVFHRSSSPKGQKCISDGIPPSGVQVNNVRRMSFLSELEFIDDSCCESPSETVPVEKNQGKLKRIMPFVPYVLLVLFCLASSGCSMLIANSVDFQQDARQKTSTDVCVFRQTRFGAHLFYTISLISTIGYGTLRPCSTGMKLFTLLTSAIGLPLFFYVIVDSGDRLATWFHQMQVKRKTAKLSVINAAIMPLLVYGFEDCNHQEEKPADEKKIDVEDLENEDLNPWLSLIALSFAYLLIVVYYIIAESYTVLDALYYSLMIFLAGDFTMDKYVFATPVYVLVIIGFAMVSMTVNVLLANVRRLMKRIHKSVTKQLAQAEAKGIPLPPLEGLMKQALVEAGAVGFGAKVISERNMNAIKATCGAELKQAEKLRAIKAEADAKVALCEMFIDQKGRTKPCTSVPVETVRPSVSDKEAQATCKTRSAYSQVTANCTADKSLSVPENPAEFTSSHCQATPAMAEQSVQAIPETRTVKMQHPRSNHLSPISLSRS